VGDGDKEALEDPKRRLAKTSCLNLPCLDQPFFISSNASDVVIGAQLCQDFDGVRKTVALFSRNLTQSQLNWAVKEKEMYAFVACLHKWSGLMKFQPLVVQTDDRTLEHWVAEHVDTPSGPRGMRGRWHDIVSQFDLTIEYLPGKDNIVADTLSRFAYPATSAKQDISCHGSAFAKSDAEKQIFRELAEGRQLTPLTNFVSHANLTSEERAKADKKGQIIWGNSMKEMPGGGRVVLLRGW